MLDWGCVEKGQPPIGNPQVTPCHPGVIGERDEGRSSQHWREWRRDSLWFKSLMREREREREREESEEREEKTKRKGRGERSERSER